MLFIIIIIIMENEYFFSIFVPLITVQNNF